ncbi:MAG: Nudix family hydrolase [Burkholderiales bacterium]|nr:Nudix family hydrolase [Burkholderiales bacterium]
MTSRITDVAVAVFIKPDGSFLLSSRPEGKPYSGYWEFPGGKIEAGESVLQAMKRELMEELNVTITSAMPWFTFRMVYTHATVRLHCWRVREWQGEMRGLEGQQFQWQRLAAITVAPTLPGCVPILRALALPAIYAITNASEIGIAAYMQQLEKALANGLKLIQIREKGLSHDDQVKFAKMVVDLAHAFGAKALLNGDIEMARQIGADGVHLTSRQLSQCTRRPDVEIVAASTHSREELERAAELKLDFVVLGAVKPTRTHPGQAGIGWEKFSAMVEATPLPVYALGGLVTGDLNTAMLHGAHGVALQRGLAA